MAEMSLTHFNKARSELVLATKLDEVKDIRDKAEALRIYAKQSGESLEMQNQCGEIKNRADRRWGQLYSEQEKNPGGQAEHKAYQSQEATSSPPTLKDMGVTKSYASRCQKIAEIPEEIFEEHISQTKDKAGKDRKTELTTTGLLNVANKIIKAAKIEEIKSQPVCSDEGPFDVIIIDPPWKYDNRAGDPTHRAANPFPDMTVDEIKNIPIADKTTENSIVWLWTTNAFLHDAFHVLEAWGFTYKTLLTWEKDKMGLGDWLRGKTEHCLFAVKGKPVTELTNQTTIIHGPLREHSRKPDEFYKMVVDLCPGSRADWCSREVREGFVSIGNEPTKFQGN